MNKILLDPRFFLEFDLNFRSEFFNIVNNAADGEFDKLKAKDVIDRVVNAQFEWASKYKLLAEKEKELFGDDASQIYNRLIFKKEADRFKKDNVMQYINDLWLKENDADYQDRWFYDRYNDLYRCCFHDGLRGLQNLLTGLDFRNKKLGLTKYHDDYLLDGKEALWGDIAVSFDEHNIWDAVLFALFARWFQNKRLDKYIVIPIFNGTKIYPRVTIHDNRALVSYCVKDNAFGNDTKEYRIYRRFVLVQKKDDSIFVIGGYEVFIGVTTIDGEEIEKPEKEISCKEINDLPF